MDHSWVILAVKVEEPSLERALDEAGAIADLLRNNAYEHVTVLNTIPAPSGGRPPRNFHTPHENPEGYQNLLGAITGQTYLDREIKARLERGDSHKDIAACCGVSETEVERLASGA